MVAGMEKSFSGLPNYEPVVETHIRTDQGISRWPTSLSPADFPLKILQASIPPPTSRSSNGHMGQHLPQDSIRFRRQQYEGSMQHKSYKEPIQAAAKAGPTTRLAIEQHKTQQHIISTAPQTRSQQQLQALKKFSQAVSNESWGSSSPLDLEQAVLRILSGSNDASEGDDEQTENRRTNKVSLTKSEAIKAAQAISNLIKQSPGSAYSQPRKVNQNFATNPKVCDRCGYAVARACDLKKHMKRHEKPYGCTYPKCHKRFGAKSDWKRHENSQHFQLEAFRCDQESNAGQTCGEHFLRMEHFKKHLEAQHEIFDEQKASDEVKRRRIGKNCQQQFWCGFHVEVVELKGKRNAAWDERFDHIAYHFEKEKRSIEEWVCPEENKTKKELQKELDRYVFEHDDERGNGDVGGAGNWEPSSNPPIFKQTYPCKRGAPAKPLYTGSHKKPHLQGHYDILTVAGNDIKLYCVRITTFLKLLKLTSTSASAEMALVIACCNQGA
jgi:hypothetical protein